MNYKNQYAVSDIIRKLCVSLVKTDSATSEILLLK